MKKFKNSNQLRSFMKKEASRLNISISNVYSTFVARSFLERLSKHNSNVILIKGSSAEIAYLGRLVRSITDVDLATLNTLKINEKLFSTILNDEVEDYFNFKLIKEPKKTPTGVYKMSLETHFDKTRQPLSIDFQENYNRLIEPQMRIMPPIFEDDEPFEIYVPSFEEYLAEKLCIILENNKLDIINTRIKDFYDIYQLHGGKYDSDKLTKYFGKMLKLRGKVKLEETGTLGLNKRFVSAHEQVWEYSKRKYGFVDQEIDLAGAVYYTRAVLREQLQKCGNEMADNIAFQRKKQ